MSQSHLDSLFENTNSTLELLSSLSVSFEAVETQTTAFRKQCESLVTEQQRLIKLADDIRGNLQCYNYLEPLTRRLNAPGAGNSVGSKGFSDMLLQLDRCLAYMQAHVCASRHYYQSIADFTSRLSEKLKLTAPVTDSCLPVH